MKNTVTLDKLRKMIKEELTVAKRSLKEDVDHEGAKTVIDAASKLLSAIASFAEAMTPPMANAVTPHLDQLKQAVEPMVSNPASYTQKVEPTRVVKLRAVQGEEVN